MSIEVQRRRGTTAQHATFTGAAGEITVDTDKNTAVVHDGSTAGGFPLALEGNLVMTTATATATYYALLATLSYPATNNVAANLSILLTPKSASGAYAPVLLTVTALQGTAGLSTTSSVQILSTEESAVAYNDLFLVTSSATNGSDIRLYMQSIIAAAYDVQVLGSSFDTGVSATWNNGATWTVTDPTSGAAASITSDWAGSGQLTSTSFSNGWAGTAYYEKHVSGLVLLTFAISTPGTTTNGTLVFTVPAGYRPGFTNRTVILSVNGTDGADGYFNINADGTVTVHDYNAGNPTSAAIAYLARG